MGDGGDGGRARTAALALERRHHEEWQRATLDDRLAWADEMIVLAERAGEAGLALTGHTFRVVDLLEGGDLRATDAALTVRAELAATANAPWHHQHTAVLAAMRATLAGRFDDAERSARAALRIGEQIGDPNAHAVFAMQTMLLGRLRGQLPDLGSALAPIAARFPDHPAWQAGLAYVHAFGGRPDDARREVGRIAVDGFAGVPRDAGWLATMSLLTETCALSGDAARAAPLYELLLPFRERMVVVGLGVAVLGAVAYFLARLAVVLARWDDALAHLERALEIEERAGARPCAVHTRHVLGALLVARHGGDAADRGRAILRAALGAAERMGMAISVARLREHLAAADDAAPDGDVSSDLPSGCALRREGQHWVFVFEGTACRLRDAKGLHHLAVLLRHPRREFLALELAAGPDAPTLRRSGPGARRQDGRRAASEPARSAETQATWAARLAGLRDQQREAEQANDLGRARRAADEIARLGRQVAEAIGLGSAGRDAAGPAEQARLVVTKRIRATLRRVAAAHPALAYHLETTVRTGTFCGYFPPPGRRVVWLA